MAAGLESQREYPKTQVSALQVFDLVIFRASVHANAAMVLTVITANSTLKTRKAYMFRERNLHDHAPLHTPLAVPAEKTQ